MRTSVAVCALTCQRPAGLSRLIRGLAELTFDGEPPEVTIVVVDNDPQGSARQACTQLGGETPWPIRYVIEPQRGIPFARNTALDSAGDAEWICFIDDDEVPQARWLDELLRVQREHDADVVAGPVLSQFSAPVPEWIERGHFFDPPRRPTGQRIDQAFTGNVLFRAAVPRELGLRFDIGRALAGGTDALFFRRIDQAGRKMVWADEAVAVEYVPATRATARWILQRAFRYGNSSVGIARDLHPEQRPHLDLLVRGLRRLLAGIVLLPVTVFLGRHRAVTSLRHVCYGAGTIAGWFGLRYREYHRTHGS